MLYISASFFNVLGAKSLSWFCTSLLFSLGKWHLGSLKTKIGLQISAAAGISAARSHSGQIYKSHPNRLCIWSLCQVLNITSEYIFHQKLWWAWVGFSLWFGLDWKSGTKVQVYTRKWSNFCSLAHVHVCTYIFKRCMPYNTRRPIKCHHSFCSILRSYCFLRGRGTDSKGSDVNTATIPVIAELLELLFLSDQHVPVCPISISINFEFLIC